MSIRLAREEELPGLRQIEVAAGRLFAAIGMTAVAGDEAPSLEVFRGYQRDGRAWVDTDDDNRPVAFLLADWVDGNVHIEQVSVHPDVAGKRIGAGLIEHVAAWARERSAPALTLTTFAEVVWNAPYYERCGFRRMSPDEETPGLRKIRAEEIAHGLDEWPRLCMRREL
jgi:GNAT superfamily N-acetyltransferase